jgi:hypothetical protein
VNQDLEKIVHKNQLMAIIIRSDFTAEGILFLTPNNFSQQLGYMNRPADYRIAAHKHNKMHREVFYTQEVLFIKKGKVKVDFYDEDQNYLEFRILQTGDVILLASGGHGFEMIEPTEMIEVKQGPYSGDRDKMKFEPEN